jgi:hypothetical protein
VWGGRWSDYELTRLKTANDGRIYPEVSECVAALIFTPLDLEEHHQSLVFIALGAYY